MTEHEDLPGQWNNESRISCAFTFKCPNSWERLTLTDDPNTRHCGACDRDVQLVRTEAAFKRQADAGQCVAVRLSRNSTEPASGVTHIVGSLASWPNSR